jgi:hypothetical protein
MAIDENLREQLSGDYTGLAAYEYIANNIGEIDDILPDLVDIIIEVDSNGQFVVSTARYLHAIDSERYAASISELVKAAIEKDRERNYLGDLIASIYGNDYKERAEELSAQDDNFRRIYKRLYPIMGI